MVAMMSIYCKKKKKLMSSEFKRKFSRNVSVIRIDIHRDKRKGVLGLSQEAYLEKLQRNIVCMRVNLRLFSLSRVMVLGTFMFQELI
jgi:hypothetical protein